MYALYLVLNILMTGTADISLIQKETNFSESKIRRLLNTLRRDGQLHGFKIETIRNQGYSLKILDQESIRAYLTELNIAEEGNVEDKKKRTAFIIYFLICMPGYCTIDTIADTLGVHRRTISNSLKEVQSICETYHLTFKSKRHYGITITGDELDIRKLFSKVIIQISNTNHGIYKEFESIKQDPYFQEHLVNTLKRNNIILTTSALESFILHISVLLLRVREKNHVTEITVDKNVISDNYYQAAAEIIAGIERKYKVVISSQEQDLIATQLFGKAVLEEIPKNAKDKMQLQITETLLKIDREYQTNYAEDTELAEGLLMHLYPLVIRLTWDLELSNALFQTLPAQYTNSFIVAIRFIALHPELKNYRFSRDEIGYLALHFASHQERKNTHYIKRVHSIVFIYQNMRSESYLAKMKLEQAFPNAKVRIVHESNIHKYRLEDIDLILTTNANLNLDKESFVVDEHMNDREIERIKNVVLFNYHAIINESVRVEDLFKENLFFYEQNRDYITILKKYTRFLEKKNYAQVGFSTSVLERENRLDTVYENGIAGPHSIVPLGNVDCIATVILKEPIVFNHKEVKCIFLINIRNGHMVLHQGISQLIVKLMSEKGSMEKITSAQSFEEFIKLIKHY